MHKVLKFCSVQYWTTVKHDVCGKQNQQQHLWVGIDLMVLGTISQSSKSLFNSPLINQNKLFCSNASNALSLRHPSTRYLTLIALSFGDELISLNVINSVAIFTKFF